MSRHILIIEDEQELRDELSAYGRQYYGFEPNDSVKGCADRAEVHAYMESLNGATVAIALIDLVLNEKPMLAYTKIRQANELEGIELLETYHQRFKQKIFVTSEGNYRKAVTAGFDFNRPDCQVCLKTNRFDAPEAERFPYNLIAAIKQAYGRLENS